MDFLRISPEQMKKSFFDEMRYFIWISYDYDNYFELLHKDGKIYRIEYSKILEKFLPIIKRYNQSKNLCGKWFWHFMELGGGVVFIHEKIVESYKKYAKIDGDFQVAGPNFDAAIKAVKEVYNNWIYLGERYFLGQPKENNLLIFGINPSTATPNNLDSTMKHIIKIIENSKNVYASKDFSDFGWIMMNLYPQVTPNPDELKFDSKIMDRNFEQIEFVLKNFKVENIWCAWGDSIDISGKNFLYDSLKKIYKILSNYNVKFWRYGNITTKNNPFHPLYKPVNLSFDEFDIKNYIALKK